MKPLRCMAVRLALSLTMFSAMVDQGRCQSPVSGKTPSRVAELDRNGDGKIARDEVSDAVWKRIATHDVNGDGLLAGEELAGLARKGEPGRRPGGATAAFQVLAFKASDGHTLSYSLFAPAKVPAGVRLPLVLCLHGKGGGSEAARVVAQSDSQQRHPCFAMAPACGENARWVESTFRGGKMTRAVLPELKEALDSILASHPIDPDRVYVTGQSMGGVGTWGIIAALPQRFAAAVPVCGHWEPKDAPQMAQVAVWAFHGANDKAVPVEGSRQMVAALKAVGASPRYTEYADLGHGCWERAYATGELWDWLFAQHR